MNEIKVDITRLGMDADQVLGLINKMNNKLKDMKTSVDQLNTMWEGPAKQAFIQAVEVERVTAEEIINKIRSMHGFEAQAKDKYEKCEKQISFLIDEIKI